MTYPAFRLCALGLSLAAALFQGCTGDPCHDYNFYHRNTGITLEKAKPGSSPRGRGAADLQPTAAAATTKQSIVMKALADQPEHVVFSFPNDSFGKFVGQVTVGYASVNGLADGESAGLLEFRQPQAASAARRIYLGAVYDALIGGLHAQVFDLAGTALGTAIAFNGATKIDLRIEQTDSALIFSARASSADSWMPVYTLTAAPDPAAFHVYIGTEKLHKGAAFSFTDLALDGEAIGGTVEYPIIDALRTSVEAIQSAQAKIEASDLAGAVTALGNAVTANTLALNKLNAGQYSLQRPTYSLKALKNLNTLAKNLDAAKDAVTAAADASKAKPQLAKLDSVVKGQYAAMTSLLGLNAAKLNFLPTFLFLRVP